MICVGTCFSVAQSAIIFNSTESTDACVICYCSFQEGHDYFLLLHLQSGTLGPTWSVYFTAFTANLGNRLLKTSANSNLFVSVIHFLLCFSSSSSVLSVARLTDDPLTLVWQGFNYQTACTVLWPLAPSYKEQKNSSVSPWCTVSQSLTGSFVRCYIVYSICSKWIGVDLTQLAYNHTMPWMLCVLFAMVTSNSIYGL